MSLIQRVSYQAFFGLQMMAYSVTRALAQNALGPTDDVPIGTQTTDLRETIINILKYVLNFMALVAVIFIVIAGIRLIVSQGEDEQKEKAKKTIIYVVVGLIVILFARVIVEFVTSTASDGFQS